MIWFILFCSIVMVYLDYKSLHILFAKASPRTQQLALWAAIVVDTLPFLMLIAGFVIKNDNQNEATIQGMWIYFIYMVAAISRAPFNLAVVVSRNRVLHSAAALLGAGLVVLFFYSMAITRTDYQIKRVEIASERLPQSFDGFKVVVISDLHIGSMLHPERELSRIAELCNNEQGDMIAFCGDMVHINHREVTPPIAKILGKFRAKEGLFSITGNHDLGVYTDDSIRLIPARSEELLLRTQRRAGWMVLDNQSDYIRRGGDSIIITGVSFSKELQEHRHDAKLPTTDIEHIYEGLPTELFNITLVHIPQLWEAILEHSSADLTLAGHVHAMQIKLPIGERGISPAMLQYKRWSGLYSQGERHLYINDGIGYGLFPMRIGARPEITVITLRSR